VLKTYALPGNWTLEVDDTTHHFDLYFTRPDTGKRALYGMTWGPRRHPSLPEYQPLIYEVAKEDGSIGLVCPFVAKYHDQWYIAVERNERHVGERVEVSRKAWDNPSDLPKIPEGAKFERYDLGRGDSNTARIVGGDGIIHNIVILSGLEELPELPGKPFWMKFETYAESRDQMGLSVLGKAYIKGLLV
jgi:hypothetical protein